jgi:hypothetical protein
MTEYLNFRVIEGEVERMLRALIKSLEINT